MPACLRALLNASVAADEGTLLPCPLMCTPSESIVTGTPAMVAPATVVAALPVPFTVLLVACAVDRMVAILMTPPASDTSLIELTAVTTAVFGPVTLITVLASVAPNASLTAGTLDALMLVFAETTVGLATACWVMPSRDWSSTDLPAPLCAWAFIGSLRAEKSLCGRQGPFGMGQP